MIKSMIVSQLSFIHVRIADYTILFLVSCPPLTRQVKADPSVVTDGGKILIQAIKRRR